MSKSKPENPSRPEEFRYQVNARSLQNGIGIASLVGIGALLVSLAFDSGSPSSGPTALTSGPIAPVTTTAESTIPSGISVAPLTSAAQSPTPQSGSLTSTSTTSPPKGSASGPAHAATASASGGSGASASSSPSGQVASGGAAPTTTTATTQPQGGAASTTTTTSIPPWISTTTTTTTTTIPTRQVTGTAVTVGAGNFTGGTDVAPGLYDVTAGPNQSGTFVVTGSDSYNEILDSSGSRGVPTIRVQITKGDQIRISGLSQVVFTPVSTPFVTTHGNAVLYAGTWTVGQDLGPGKYVATPGAGQSGRVTITGENVDVILGGDPHLGGVPSVTFTVQNGDVIEIAGLRQVTLTPS